MIFSTDETLDLGQDSALHVADDYPDNSTFTGRVDWVQLDIGDDNHDHLISADDLVRVAMTRQ